MSARSKKSINSDDLGLSLTGSQIAGLAGGKRPSSAKSSHHRPPLVTAPKSTTNLSNGNAGDRSTPKTKHTRSGSHGSARSVGDGTARGGGDGAQSARTDLNSVASARDDFLALFESSTQPKIGKPKAQQRATQSRRGGLSQQSYAKSRNRTSDSLKGAPSTPTSFQHSIFQPLSARTSSTVDDDYENQNYLPISTPVNDTLFTNDNMNSNNYAPQLNSQRGLSADGNLGSEILNSQRIISGDKSDRRATSPLINSITNNMTSQGMTPGVKTALIDIQNSYQNIKHKTPVNQVRKVSSSHTAAESNVSEDYVKKVNMAATKIQRWYLRHQVRSKAGTAAIKRLLDTKRMEKEAEMKSEHEFQLGKEQQILDERKRMREQRAKQARQEAIQELHRKREERRSEIKKKAEEEVAFLQASGKITKQPAVKSNVRKKVLTKTRPRNQTRVSSDSDSEKRSSDNEAHLARSGSKGNNGNTSSNIDDFFQDNIGRSNQNNEVSKKEGVSPNNVTVRSEGEGEEIPATPSHAPTKTTFNDLMDTLRLLEEEEKFPNPQNENTPQLGEENDQLDSENARYLSAGELEKLNPGKQNLSRSGLLSEEKLRSIMSFLDEVETADRLSQIDQDINKINESLEKPALMAPSAEEMQHIESVTAVASEVTNTVLSQRLQLEEKHRSVTMLQKALNQQRELTVRHARETEKEMKRRLDIQKDEYEETIKRHLGFIDQLIDDKKALSEKCEQLVTELKQMDKKYSDKMKTVVENHDVELKKIKDVQMAAEKLRREKWIDEKTKKIKEMTVKGLEPEIQRLIAKHKSEIKKLKSIHEAELLESDERAGQRYIKLTEELRDQLAKEKEAACARERELARQTYEKQMSQEEEAYQQQRRRLFAEVQEEKERVAQQAARQRTELDKLQRQLEDSQSKTAEAMRMEYEKAREEQERRHVVELQQLRDQLTLEKEAWEENLMKKQETWMLQKERELKEQVRRERDKEIEMVIGRLEEDNLSSREECERVSENKIRRLREKYESEIRELERSERNTMEKYNELKGKFAELEGDNERTKALMKQKDYEIEDVKKLSEKLNQERERVADIIRQEFADRLVATDEENKRLKNEMSELKARQRLEVERVKADVEVVQRAKEEEMQEVHKRVKQAIVKKEEVVKQLREQYQAAVKRADHLEGLLEQQRKQLLGRK